MHGVIDAERTNHQSLPQGRCVTVCDAHGHLGVSVCVCVCLVCVCARARVARVCNQRATLPLGPRSASKSRPESRVRRRNLRTHARPRTLMALTPPQTSQEKLDQSLRDGALFYLRRGWFHLCVFRCTALVVDKAGAV